MAFSAPAVLSHLRADDAKLIGHYTTVFPGSAPDRNYNMARACHALSGVVVAPGQTFSFNQTVGPADKSTGYRKGRVFVGDRIVEDYGGGVCQVVSTLYNAVVRAGLPVVERRLHGLTVPYLPPGQDATVAYGSIDFRFRNPRNEPVLIEAEAQGGRVTINLIGPGPVPEVWFRHRILSRARAGTISLVDPSLPPGQQHVLFPGQEGLTVHSRLIRLWPDGKREDLDLGQHTYRPSPRLIRVGPGPTAGGTHLPSEHR